MVTTFLLFAAIGCVAGLIAGLFGLGGGVIIVPALIYAFDALAIHPDIATHLAIGTSLGCITITSSVAIYTHWQRRAIDIEWLRWLVPGVIVGGWLGGLIASAMGGAGLQLAFAIFLILVACSLLFLPDVEANWRPASWLRSMAGVIIGTISALFGIGGGSLTVPFLRFSGVPMSRAVATSAALGFPIAVAGVISYIIHGQGHSALPEGAWGFFYVPAFAGIVVCSAPAARYGARLAHRLPAEQLQRAFAVFSILIALELGISALQAH